jgi:hypothetical protein
MSTLKVDTIQDQAGGNASTPDEIYSGRAKAWVNFDGTTGTLNQPDVTIRASFNVSSVTDNGTGDYTVTFTNQMSDANYATSITSSNSPGNGLVSFIKSSAAVPTSAAVRVECTNVSPTATDNTYMNVIIFR